MTADANLDLLFSIGPDSRLVRFSVLVTGNLKREDLISTHVPIVLPLRASAIRNPDGSYLKNKISVDDADAVLDGVPVSSTFFSFVGLADHLVTRDDLFKDCYGELPFRASLRKWLDLMYPVDLSSETGRVSRAFYQPAALSFRSIDNRWPMR